MTIRLLALALLAGSSLAFAAPPKPADPKTPPQDEPASIDVDAMARAKDEGSATPSPADAPPA
ncbi:MAG TPA: hypothetical protein VJ696_09275, partial [Rhodanobacteraceae bacterium]|nr:hypothetical protein [Rhodanobacteraceae bacterium]